MITESLIIDPAAPGDLTALRPLIERAYRGDSARMGWSHEADLLDDERLDDGELEAIVASRSDMLLIARDGEAIVGCVHVAHRRPALCYLGLLCVEPRLQAAGIGRRLIAEAEHIARDRFGATAIEMTVIENRAELIAYYERRGWRATGERRDFPVPLTPPLFMTVLEKRLD